MIFPPIIKENDTIGVAAPSSGEGGDLAAYELSLSQLKKAGFQIIETASVRNVESPSNTAKARVQEWMQLWNNPEVQYILSAKGGDFLEEILPLLDWETIVKRPLWVQGYSDNTGLLFPLTTKYDIATVYGPNACGFDMTRLDPSLEITMDYMKGNFREQQSFEKYQLGWGEGVDGYDLNTPVVYELPNGPVDVTGRLIGGCLDVLQFLIGTPYEDVKGFIKRYQDDGIVWFFDIFAMKAEDVAHTLWAMKQAGWFEHTKAIIVGRVCFPGSMMDMSYAEAFLRVLGTEIPMVLNADVGHVKPMWTMVNGAMCHLSCANGKGSIKQWMD